MDTASEGFPDMASGGSRDMASASGGFGDMASGGSGGTNHMYARPLRWSGMFMMTTPKKPGEVGRLYHSRGQRRL